MMKKYAEYKAAEPYFDLVRKALGDLVDGVHFFDVIADNIVYEVFYDLGWPQLDFPAFYGRENLTVLPVWRNADACESQYREDPSDLRVYKRPQQPLQYSNDVPGARGGSERLLRLVAGTALSAGPRGR
jgi:hypothetical protein